MIINKGPIDTTVIENNQRHLTAVSSRSRSTLKVKTKHFSRLKKLYFVKTCHSDKEKLKKSYCKVKLKVRVKFQGQRL
jgi:hypothetical protein